MTRNVHTTLDEDTWRLAAANGVAWNEALKIGIETLINVPDKEKNELLARKDKLLAEIRFIEQQLVKIEEENRKKEKENKKGQVVFHNDGSYHIER